MKENKDAIVVLGGGINPNGSLRGPSTCRVKTAADLFHKNIAPYIIASSKLSMVVKFIPPFNIAQSMKKALIGLKVPEEKIFTEEESRDTIGNIYFTKIFFLEPKNWKNITIVTSPFQHERALYLCEKILGPNYHINFVLSENGLSGEDLKLQEELEQRQLKFTKEELDPISNGDDEAIKRWITEVHPSYAKNPKYTVDEYLEKALGNKRSPFHEDSPPTKIQLNDGTHTSTESLTKLGLTATVGSANQGKKEDDEEQKIGHNIANQ